MIILFLTRHRTDDRLGSLHLMIDHHRLFVGDLHPAGHLLGKHLHQLRHRAKLLELPKLARKILKRKLICGHFTQLFLGFVLADLGLNFFNQAQDVAHSQDALSNAIRIERLDRVVFLADAYELDRLADDLSDRKCRTTASVAV